MEFFQGETNDIAFFFREIGTRKEDDVEYYKNFDLMKPSIFHNFKQGMNSEVGCRYLLLLEGNEVIGVLKWKRYGLPNHEFVSEDEVNEKESYVAIRLIDVNEKYRQEGHALELIRYWSRNILRLEDIVVGGKATPKGKGANIHSWLEREIKQKYYISEIDLINEWEEKNEEF